MGEVLSNIHSSIVADIARGAEKSSAAVVGVHTTRTTIGHVIQSSGSKPCNRKMQGFLFSPEKTSDHKIASFLPNFIPLTSLIFTLFYGIL
jgi:hypothetical protein